MATYKVNIVCMFTVTAKSKREAILKALDNADYNGGVDVILDDVCSLEHALAPASKKGTHKRRVK